MDFIALGPILCQQSLAMLGQGLKVLVLDPSRHTGRKSWDGVPHGTREVVCFWYLPFLDGLVNPHGYEETCFVGVGYQRTRSEIHQFLNIFQVYPLVPNS